MTTHLTASLALIAFAGCAASAPARADAVASRSSHPDAGSVGHDDAMLPDGNAALGDVPTGPVSTDIGLIAEADTVVVASAMTINSPGVQFNLAIFDRNGEVVGFSNTGSTGSTSLVAGLSAGTYYLASWGGLGTPSSPWQVPAIGFGTGIGARIGGDVHTEELGNLDSAVAFYRFYVGAPSVDPTGVVVTTRARFNLETTNDDLDTELGLYTDTGRRLRSDDASFSATRIYLGDTAPQLLLEDPIQNP